MSSSNQNMDFWDLPASGLKKIPKNRNFGSPIEKKHQYTNKLWNDKKTKNDTINNLYAGI